MSSAAGSATQSDSAETRRAASFAALAATHAARHWRLLNQWNQAEVDEGYYRDPLQECNCIVHPASAEQQRIRLLEAEVELRQLRDRVRKMMDKLLREVTSRHRTTDYLGRRLPANKCTGWAGKHGIHLEWKVTPAEIALSWCFWKHRSALARVNLTDCLKEVAKRRKPPPEAKQAIVMAVWDLEGLVRAYHTMTCNGHRTLEEDREFGPLVIDITKILPMYAWEVDLLRRKPRLTKVFARLLTRDREWYAFYMARKARSNRNPMAVRSSRLGSTTQSDDESDMDANEEEEEEPQDDSEEPYYPVEQFYEKDRTPIPPARLPNWVEHGIQAYTKDDVPMEFEPEMPDEY